MSVIYFGASTNPTTLAHRDIVLRLAQSHADEVVVSICGPRDDKRSSQDISASHRAALAVLGFPDLPSNVRLDLTDLTRINQDGRTSTYWQMHRLQDICAGAIICCAVGADLVKGVSHESSTSLGRLREGRCGGNT